MPPSRGKKFETEISRMLRRHPGIAYYYRPPDVPPAQRARFMTRNPIDFYCYLQGGQGLIVECKAVQGKSLSFSRFAPHQWGALFRCWRAGIQTVVMLNWYGPSCAAGREGQRGRAYAIPFIQLVWLRQQLWHKRKSWPLADLTHEEELRKVSGSWEWNCNQNAPLISDGNLGNQVKHLIDFREK